MRRLIAWIGLLALSSGGAWAQSPAPAPRRDYTDADVQFVRGMIMHHAQAVVMSDWAPTHGARPDIATLCKRIALSQRDEIKIMQQWLQDRGLTAPDPLQTMKDMPGTDMGPTPMAGMLTTEEMRQLDAARDTTFDRLYLTGMIRHHQGALAMVANLFAAPGSGQQADLFGLATDVDAGQRVEIARMQAMLNALNASPHPS
jgi:uncharacterized protein (DUF305 family)